MNNKTMGQIFTINLNKSSYQFQVVKLNQKERYIESDILLQGTTSVTLCKDSQKGWLPKAGSNQIEIEEDLIRAIGNSISLRYRV